MITVFGSINLDISTRVDRLPGKGETVLGDGYRLAPGGKGANQALAAMRAGARVRLVGAVGRDAFAEPALELLREAGMDLGAVRRSVQAPTGLALIAVDARGENQIVVAPGANAEVSADDLTEAMLERSSLLVAQMELRPSEVVQAIAKARAAGVRVVLNLAPAAQISESALDAVHLLVLNEIEARTLGRGFALSGANARQLAGAIAERRQGPVVLTAGAEGAYLATSRYAIEQVAAPEANVVDTTGAGDALVGVLAAAVDVGAPLLDAVRRGVVAGALACAKLGAQTALPTAAEIEAALSPS